MKSFPSWQRFGPHLLVAGLLVPTAAAAGQPATRPVEPLDIPRQLEDPPELLEAHQRRLEQLRDAVEAAGETMDKAAAHLALANWTLSVQAARPATRWLMGFETQADLETLSGIADTAEKHLARGRTLLEDEPPANAEQRHRDLQTAAEVLKSFAALFAVAGVDDNSDPPPPPEGFVGEGPRAAASSEAALELSVAREADVQEVAAAAQLWQSFALHLAGRHERALTTLPEALSRPKDLPYEYMSRLLRCRILSEIGQPAAAMALVMRIRSATEDWSPGQTAEAVEARRRLAAMLELQVGRRWLEELQVESPAAATHLQGLLNQLQTEHFPESQPQTVYVLGAAVPIIVEPIAVQPEVPETAPESPPMIPADPLDDPADDPVENSDPDAASFFPAGPSDS